MDKKIHILKQTGEELDKILSLKPDSVISDESENAVQNKVVKKYVDQRAQQAYDQALEYTDENILELIWYTDERVTPLYIEFGAVFPTTTTAGTIFDSGYDAEEIAEAISSGKGVMLIDSNGDTLFLSYYRHEEGKLLLQAVTHSSTGYLRLSLLFAAGTTACIWTSDQHNINEAGTGGGASIPVVSTEEELDALSQNKGELAVILSDDTIAETAVPALELHQATGAEIESAIAMGTGFTQCDSIAGVTIDTEVAVPPCLSLAGQSVSAVIAARGFTNSELVGIDFGTLSEEGYLGEIIFASYLSGASGTIATYDATTGKVVVNEEGLIEFNDAIAALDDPVWVYLIPSEDTFWDNIDEDTLAEVNATFAFMKAKVNSSVLGIKSIRVKNDEGYSRLDSDVIRVVSGDMASALNGLDMPLGSLVRVFIPEHIEFNADVSLLKCCITDPEFDSSKASVISGVSFVRDVYADSFIPYFKLTNIDNTETIRVDWNNSDDALDTVVAQHFANGETSEIYLYEDGIWNESAIADVESIIASGVNVALELGKNGSNLYNPATGNLIYLEDESYDDETKAYLGSMVNASISIYVSFRFDERTIPDIIEKYARVSNGWVKEVISKVSEWTDETSESSDPVEAQLVYKTFKSFESMLEHKQERLVSGENIATVNGHSLLEGGDIVIEGGSGGGSGTVDDALSTTSTNPLQNKVITEELNKKVNSVLGKGLSTNDYTTSDKNKLSGIAANAQVNVQSDWNATSGDAFIKNKPTFATINGQRIDQGGEIDIEAGDSITVDSVLSGTSENAIQNKVVTEALDRKQPRLVSGSNIKTINGQPILGSGDLIIGGDEGAQVVLFDATCAQYPYDLPELTTTTDVQTITDAIALSQPIYIQFAAALCPATEASLVNGSPHLFLHIVDAEAGTARMIHIYAYDTVWTWETFEKDLGGGSGDYVRSVNGITPDDNGNVQIEVNIDGEVVDATLSSLVGSGSTFTLEELVG